MKTLTRFVWLAVALGLLAYLGLTLWLGALGLLYPYQLDYGEGIVLWFAQQLAHGQPIYKSLADYPYASSNYPPVAMLLSAMLMPVFGDGYVSGRLLNFAAALIVAMLIFKIVQTEARDKRIAALAALFFLGSPYVYHWIPLFRVDLIGVAFAVAGIFCIWSIEQTADRRPPTADRSLSSAVVFAILFCLLALFTKHTLFAAPVAAFLALWMQNRKQAIAFAVALGISGGALYLLIDYLTRGGFTLGLLESNATVFLFDQLIALLQNFVITFAILLLLAAWAWLDRVRAKKIGVLEWYTVTSFAMLVLSGRMGAWENYFFEAIAVACIFAGLAVSHQPSAVSRQPSAVGGRFSSFILPSLLLLQLVLFTRDHDPRIAADLIARDLPANQQLAALLKQTPGDVIAEDMGALATSGKPVVYYTFQYSSLARSGKWDQAWELNGLRDAKFPLVILETGTREDVDHYRRFTREFVSALDRYYAQTESIGKYQVYAPAPPLNLQSANFGDALGLVGWNAPAKLRAGDLPVAIVWQAQRAMPQRYKAFVHLEKFNGDKVTQDDREPRNGSYPTNRWAASEMVREMYLLKIPDDLPAGIYNLKIGWYDVDTDERLPVPGTADNAFVLATYAIK